MLKETNAMSRRIYVFGNKYLKDDSFAHKIADELRKSFRVVECTSPEAILESREEEVVIIDVVKNVKKPIIIEDVKKIKTRSIVSLHDFDLGFFLRLMQELGIAKKIKIIGVPMQGNAKKVLEEVRAWL